MKLVVRQRGGDRHIEVEREGSKARVQLDEVSIEVDVHSLGGAARSILRDGRHFDVSVRHLGNDRYEVASALGSEIVTVLEPLAHLASTTHDAQAQATSERVAAYMPGRVVQLLVAGGDSVAAGQGVLVLEAMKMENEIQSERAGTIREIFVEAGQAVEGGDPLYEIE